MTEFYRAVIVSLLAIASYLLLTAWLYTPPPQVPCRCGSAPVTSVIVLPDMVVRS